jgi:hypothetical protein
MRITRYENILSSLVSLTKRERADYSTLYSVAQIVSSISTAFAEKRKIAGSKEP